jgi:hypothetical protein
LRLEFLAAIGNAPLRAHAQELLAFAILDRLHPGHQRLEILSPMIEASIPFVNARYKGDFPHPPAIAGDIDDGTWHGTLTDLLVTAHYQVSKGPVAFAPYVGIVIPTHDYPTIGHAAPARGLDEYWLGFYTAMSLNEWIPRLRGNARQLCLG